MPIELSDESNEMENPSSRGPVAQTAQRYTRLAERIEAARKTK